MSNKRVNKIWFTAVSKGFIGHEEFLLAGSIIELKLTQAFS